MHWQKQKKEKSLISHRPSCRAVTAAADLQAIKKNYTETRPKYESEKKRSLKHDRYNHKRKIK